MGRHDNTQPTKTAQRSRAQHTQQRAAKPAEDSDISTEEQNSAQSDKTAKPDARFFAKRCVLGKTRASPGARAVGAKQVYHMVAVSAFLNA